jgi:hypothetical protein
MSGKGRALGSYEKLDPVSLPGWGKNDIWRIAAEMSADDWLKTDVGEFLGEI